MIPARCLHRSFRLACLAAVVTGLPAAGQSFPQIPGSLSTLSTVSGDSADRLRISQLDVRGQSAAYLLRSVSTLLSDPRGHGGTTMRWVLPSVSLGTNTALPYGENNGALWAGKGPSARAMAGFDAAFGAVRLTVIPEIAYASNEFFEYTQLYAPALPSSRSPYASPWNVYPYSIDAPPRMGPGHVTRIAPGQSTLSMRASGYELGVTTENEWWGPGVRTGMVLSDNAEGFPRAFVRPSSPRDTRFGKFDFRLTWGGLTESDYFDRDSSNDVRYFSAFAGTWTPRLEPDLTIGMSRAVYGPSSGWGDVAIRPLNFMMPTGHPNGRALSDTTFEAGADQIMSIFGRWVFPGKGLEAYAEWARTEFPSSLRDLLVDPEHSQGYTFGLQWIGRPADWGRIRVQGEHSYMEQDPSFANRPLGSFYTSRATVQGYTNRGQVIGAGMGQGSSGEWLATDLIAPRYSAGIFLTRTRFNNDAYFLLPFPYGRGNCQHDVSAGKGIRGSVTTAFGRISGQYRAVERMNAFFQNTSECQSFENVIDVHNHSLSLTITLGR